MLKTHTTSPSTIALVSVAVAILTVALGAVVYLRMVPSAIPVEIPAENPAVVNPTEAPALAIPNPVPVRAVSIYRSEETLRRWLDEAYEQHNTGRVEKLLRTLNGRYERRSGRPY